MTKIVVTFGPKGGVGTSVMTLNLAVYLAQKGKKVLLMDAAPNGGTLHAYLGVPPWALSRVVPDFFSVLPLIDTDYPNLKFFSSLRCPSKNTCVSEYLVKWDTELKRSVFDLILIDMGAHLDSDLVATAFLADFSLLFLTPDPICIEKANHLFREFFDAQFASMVERLDIASAVQEIEKARPEHLYCPRNLLLLLGEELPRLRRSIADMVQRLHAGVVINGVRSSTDADLKDIYPLVIRNYYGFDLKGMGEVIFSDFIQSSSMTMVPVVTAERGTEFAEVFDTIAGKLLSVVSKAEHSQASSLAPSTYYELLGVHPGSSGQDIRAQYEKLRVVYAPQSPLMRDLFDSDNLYIYSRLLDSVYQNLMDPDIRREYDLVAGRATQAVEQALPEGFDIREVIRKYNRQKKGEPSVVKRDVFGREAGKAPSKGGDSFEDREPGPIIARFGDRRLTGADLRTVREEMGVSIKMISERTRISQAVIKAIEENNTTQIPGPTYLRGFLRNYCRAIRISDADTERFIADIMGLTAAPMVMDDDHQKRG